MSKHIANFNVGASFRARWRPGAISFSPSAALALLLVAAFMLIGARFGKLYSDTGAGFAIRPPSGWYYLNKSRSYHVRFYDKNYEAFIIIDSTPTDGRVMIDDEFEDFIKVQNNKIKHSVPSFKVVETRLVSVNGQRSLRTKATFKAGSNKVGMKIYYLPAEDQVFILTTICPLAASSSWDRVFNETLGTFTLLE